MSYLPLVILATFAGAAFITVAWAAATIVSYAIRHHRDDR